MNDNNKMLERVLLMMKYDSSKTLTENSDVVKNEFSQLLSEKGAPRGRARATTKGNVKGSVAAPPLKLPKGVTQAQVKLAGQYKSIYGKAPTKAQLAAFQASGGKPPKGTGSSTINVGPGYTVTAKPPKGTGGKGKPKPPPKDAGILSKFTGSVKKYPWRYALGLGLTGLGVWYFLKDNTEVSPCLLDSLTEEEMAALNGAGTSGTITRAQVGNRLADLNGGLIFSLDKPDVVTANGKYKGTYSCDGGALKISIAGSEFMLGAGTPGADKGTEGGGNNGRGGGGRYTQCPETLPIAMYCKNSTVARVQGCVGAKQDGAFGPNTSAALVAKGADGSSITQASIDKVCGPGVAAKIEKLGQDVDVEDVGGNNTSNNVNIKSSDSSEDGIGG
jgi:hypothetical protein